MTSWRKGAYQREDGTWRLPKGTKNRPAGLVLNEDMTRVLGVEPPEANFSDRDDRPLRKSQRKKTKKIRSKSSRKLKKFKSKRKSKVKDIRKRLKKRDR